MKKMIAAAAAILLTTGLTACAGNGGSSASVTSTESGSGVSAAGIKLSFPEDWIVYTGDDVYSMMFQNSGEGYETADDLKKDYEDAGTTEIFYAVNSGNTAMLSLSSLEITIDETTGERLTADEYARQNHDTAIFSYQASGLYIRNSSFAGETLAGKQGFLSHYEICLDEETSQLLMGQSEFTFEQDGKFYSLQTYYHSEDAAAEADTVLAGMTAQ